MITGFPSPAQGYEDKTINLNNLLIKHPAATIFMQVDTNAYTKIGIFNGDILIIDRALQIKKERYVVYEYMGEFKLGKVENLHSEVIVCGVITYVIHTVKNC